VRKIIDNTESFKVYFSRSSGILLHPTSLPGPFGIGDLGGEAYQFLDLLTEMGQSLWQVLPLGPTGFGDSPYASFSAFAGNPLLISPALLEKEGLLSPKDIQSFPAFQETCVEYGDVIPFKTQLLQKAYETFNADASSLQRGDFDSFCHENGSWLEDFTLFMALKQIHQAVWNNWPKDQAMRNPDALSKAKKDYEQLINAHKFFQYLFFKEWDAVKKYANSLGIRIIGDIPIFVAYDSADVWAHQDLFYLDKSGHPLVVAGVPPDYFSKTGQLWGNPLYRWNAMAKNGYNWWMERFRINTLMLDMIRLDHFRGFEAYWEIPAGEETAIKGRWVKGPGEKFFHALKKILGEIPIIAEDLGVITPEVEALRDAFGFPGMKILQFAFGGGADNPYLPHNYSPNCVVYTGTHDNDTTVGWYTSSSTPQEQDRVRRYIQTNGSEIHWDMIRLDLSSVARMAIFPLQDLLGLDGKGRMNFPGKPSGNWRWRFRFEQITHSAINRLKDLSFLFGRNTMKSSGI